MLRRFPVISCPRCGGKMFTVRQRISGIGEYYVDLETGEVEASSLHDNLQYKNVSKYAICTNCGARLFKIDDKLNVVW